MKRFLCIVLISMVNFSCQNAPRSAAVSTTVRGAGVGFEKPDPVKASSIKSEITQLRKEIADGEAESKKYGESLVKALIDSRVQIQRQTLAMLEQRDKAWTFGFTPKYMVDGTPFTLPPGAREQLPSIEAEISLNASKIQSQSIEAERSGGLVGALATATLETTKSTQAMLEQRRVAIKYEMPQYLAFQRAASAPERAATPAQATTNANTFALPESVKQLQVNPPQRSAVTAGNLEMLPDFGARVTESNSTWSKWAWKATIRNNSDAPIKAIARIKFLDRDGFVVDDDAAPSFVVAPRSSYDVQSYDLVNADVTEKIASYKVSIEEQ